MAQDNQNGDDGMPRRTKLTVRAVTLTSWGKNQGLFTLPFHKIDPHTRMFTVALFISSKILETKCHQKKLAKQNYGPSI